MRRWCIAFFNWRLASCRRSWALLLVLWITVYLIGNWQPFWRQFWRGGFDNIAAHLQLAAWFGWLLLPRSLLHLIGHYPDNAMPAWANTFVISYDIALIALQVLFLKYRRVWLLLAVLIIASVSVSGCHSYMMTVQWDR